MDEPRNDSSPADETPEVSPLDDARERVSAMFPPEFRQHYRAARREFWLAMRALIDSRISAIEEKEKPAPPPPRRGKVDITD